MKEVIQQLAAAIRKIIDNDQPEPEKLKEIYEHLSDNDKVYLAQFIEMFAAPTTGEL